jgi:arginyl-tRNA synthetase
LEGDSGPYLQYAYVRARAVLAKKAAGQLAPGELARTAARPGGLERGLIHFPSVVARAREELAPQLVVAYLTGVAAAFNRLYAREQIIGSKQEAYYLVLTAAVAQTLQNGLWLLGIDTPKRM